MTPVGVFFCWQGGAERDFVNSTTYVSRFFLPIAQEAVFIFPVLWYNAPAPLWGRTFDFPERDHGTGTFFAHPDALAVR